MKDIETQSVHVQVMPGEAVESKRNLLETELHLLNILKAMISARGLRKREFSLKTEARARMRELTREIDRILDCLPISEGVISKGIKAGRMKKRGLFEISPLKETREKKEKVKIDVELDEIKKQLDKLG